MPRPPTERPPGEHLAVLARVLRQVDASTRFSAVRKQAVKKALTKAMREIQAEMAESPARRKTVLNEILG